MNMGDIRNQSSLFSEDEVMEILQGLRKESPLLLHLCLCPHPEQSRQRLGGVDFQVSAQKQAGGDGVPGTEGTKEVWRPA